MYSVLPTCSHSIYVNTATGTCNPCTLCTIQIVDTSNTYTKFITDLTATAHLTLQLQGLLVSSFKLQQSLHLLICKTVQKQCEVLHYRRGTLGILVAEDTIQVQYSIKTEAR